MSFLIGLTIVAVAYAPSIDEVTFKGAGGLDLHGTLTIPSSKTNVPAVLLLPGSGPTDRDGNQLPGIRTDILKQISDNLVEAGFATLRFDKRATSTYRDIFMKLNLEQLQAFFSWNNFVEDATDAYKFLSSQPKVDAKRVAVVGHSEGAIITLNIGANMADDPSRPAALVSIGGTGRPMGPVLRDQIEHQLAHQPEAIQKMYLDYTDAAIAQLAKDGTLPPGQPPANMDKVFNVTNEKLWQSYLTTDPTLFAAKCKGPVLLVNGEKDTQVSPVKDTPKLEEALKARPQGGDVEVALVPGGTHNLKAATATNPDEFVGPVIPYALSKIRAFLIKELHPQ